MKAFSIFFFVSWIAKLTWLYLEALVQLFFNDSMHFFNHRDTLFFHLPLPSFPFDIYFRSVQNILGYINSPEKNNMLLITNTRYTNVCLRNISIDSLCFSAFNLEKQRILHIRNWSCVFTSSHYSIVTHNC